MTVRWICGVSLRDRNCREDLYSFLGIQSGYHDNSSTDISSTTIRLPKVRMPTFRLS